MKNLHQSMPLWPTVWRTECPRPSCKRSENPCRKSGGGSYGHTRFHQERLDAAVAFVNGDCVGCGEPIGHLPRCSAAPFGKKAVPHSDFMLCPPEQGCKKGSCGNQAGRDA